MPQNRIILINPNTGQELEATNFVVGLDSFSETLSIASDSKVVSFSTTNELTFSKAAFDLLQEALFLCPANNCEENRVLARVYIECCDQWKDYLIRAKPSIYCPFQCEVKASLETYSDADKKYECLKSYLFWENGYEDTLSTDNVPQFPNFFYSLAYMPAYNPWDAIRFNAERCDIVFESSIASDDIYQMLVLGFNWQTQNDPKIFDASKMPAWSTVTLLDKLETMFNAEYQFYQAPTGEVKLILERRDFFFEPLGTFNLFQDFSIEDPICFSYQDTESSNCGKARHFYTQLTLPVDATFEDSDIIIPAYRYQESSNWNEINNPARDKECTYEIEFTAPIFATDEGGVILRMASYIDPSQVDIPVAIIHDGNNILNPEYLSQPITSKICGHNYPLFIDEVSPNGIPAEPCDDELYNNFFFINDPDNDPQNCILTPDEDLTLRPNNFCEFVEAINNFGLRTGFTYTLNGCDYTILAEEIDINYQTSLVTLKKIFTI